MQRIMIGPASNLDLMSVDDSFANGAKPFVVERIPPPMIIDGLKDLEPFLGAKRFLHVSH